MAELVVLEDAVLNRILRDQRFLDAFPFLHNAAVASTAQANQPRKCGKCGAKNRAVTASQYAEIRRSIVSLPADRKAVFKQLLGCTLVRLVYRGHDQKMIRVTF